MKNKPHPRAESLRLRHLIEKGVKTGITHPTGLIAHGRGEAFDYLLGERTNGFAKEAIIAAAIMLTTARHPVITVNGNVTALCAKEVVALAQAIPAPIEINLFYRTKKRVNAIAKRFGKLGIRVLGVNTEESVKISDYGSKRSFMDKEGVHKADVVLVMLEDGDRAEQLIKLGKKVIAIDLNPLSRTAQKATITIVDNVVRALPHLRNEVGKTKKIPKNRIKKYRGVADYRLLRWRVNANSLRENFSNEPHTAQLAGGWLFEKSD